MISIAFSNVINIGGVILIASSEPLARKLVNCFDFNDEFFGEYNLVVLILKD